jgi:hypothetical protein
MLGICIEIKSYITLTFKNVKQKHGVRARISYSFVSDGENQTSDLGYVKFVMEKCTSTNT